MFALKSNPPEPDGALSTRHGEQVRPGEPRSMAALIGPSASIDCEPRQAREGAAVSSINQVLANTEMELTVFS